jgi:hypothetical protein
MDKDDRRPFALAHREEATARDLDESFHVRSIATSPGTSPSQLPVRCGGAVLLTGRVADLSTKR